MSLIQPTQPKSNDTINTFPFLKLPAEIRNMIYNYSLDFSHALNLINTSTHPNGIDPDTDIICNWRTTPGIMLLCRQVHEEALVILYNKQFTLNRGCTPKFLMGCFSKTFLQRIRYVAFNIDASQDVPISVSRINQARVMFPGDFRDVSVFLAIVWDQCNNLDTLKIKINASKPSVDVVRTVAYTTLHNYINSILWPLQRLRGVPKVVCRNEIDRSPMEAQAEACLKGRLSRFVRCLMSKRLYELPVGRYREISGSYRFFDCREHHLLFPEFVRWWLRVEEGRPGVTDMATLQLPTAMNRIRRIKIKKAWERLSWRCLPFDLAKIDAEEVKGWKHECFTRYPWPSHSRKEIV